MYFGLQRPSWFQVTSLISIRKATRGSDQLVGVRVNASTSSVFRRAIDIYYVVHIDYMLYILVGGLKPIGEGVIFECLQLQHLQVGLEPHPHRGDGHQKYG